MSLWKPPRTIADKNTWTVAMCIMCRQFVRVEPLLLRIQVMRTCCIPDVYFVFSGEQAKKFSSSRSAARMNAINRHAKSDDPMRDTVLTRKLLLDVERLNGRIVMFLGYMPASSELCVSGLGPCIMRNRKNQLI